MRILVVDDVTAMRKTITKALEVGGYKHVVEASSGTEAMSKMNGVDLVLTDLVMPGMHGISLIRAIRESPRYKDVPVIVISAVNSADEISRTWKAGITDYIVKPFSVPVLLEKVKALEFDLAKKEKNRKIPLREQLNIA